MFIQIRAQDLVSVMAGLLKFMHWSMNSTSTHDFIRIPLIQSLNSYNDYDIIAITETALTVFLPIRRDLPPGNIHDGVTIYYKNSLALCESPDLENQGNTLVCDIFIDKKKGQSFRNISEILGNLLLSLKHLRLILTTCANYKRRKNPILLFILVISMLTRPSGGLVTILTTRAQNCYIIFLPINISNLLLNQHTW